MAEDQIDRFNRLLGNRIGRPTTRYKSPVDQFAGAPARIRAAARGTTYIPKSITKAYKDSTSPVGRGSSVSPEVVNTIWNNTYDRLMRDFNENSAEIEAIATANQEQKDSEDRPWYGDLANAIGIGDLDDSGFISSDTGFGGSLIGRGLDILSRPAYGLAEGLQSVAEHEDQSWSPSNLASSFGDLFSGFARGFSGEDKTGFDYNAA